MSPPRRVLVIDDSAVVRFLMSELLGSAGNFEVDTAPNPVVALRKIAESRPDVLLLDLEMPEMSGFDLLRELADDPIPTVVLSAYTARGTARALEAFELGAVEVLAKPALGLEAFLRHAAHQLVALLRDAGLPQDRLAEDALPEALDLVDGVPSQGAPDAACPVIAMGASTGGPQALQRFLRVAPADLPGIVVAQHMPPGFTTALARRLDGVGPIRVREARDGDPIRPGTLLIAPGDRHLQVSGGPRSLVARLWAGPPVHQHTPSIDILFESVLHTVGGMAAAVLLSGMGTDGVEPLGRLRREGALTLVQDRDTSAVYGTAASALERGAASAARAPEELAADLAAWSHRSRPLRSRPFGGDPSDLDNPYEMAS